MAYCTTLDGADPGAKARHRVSVMCRVGGAGLDTKRELACLPSKMGGKHSLGSYG